MKKLKITAIPIMRTKHQTTAWAITTTLKMIHMRPRESTKHKIYLARIRRTTDSNATLCLDRNPSKGNQLANYHNLRGMFIGIAWWVTPSAKPGSQYGTSRRRSGIPHSRNTLWVSLSAWTRLRRLGCGLRPWGISKGHNWGIWLSGRSWWGGRGRLRPNTHCSQKKV